MHSLNYTVAFTGYSDYNHKWPLINKMNAQTKCGGHLQWNIWVTVCRSKHHIPENNLVFTFCKAVLGDLDVVFYKCYCFLCTQIICKYWNQNWFTKTITQVCKSSHSYQLDFRLFHPCHVLPKNNKNILHHVQVAKRIASSFIVQEYLSYKSLQPVTTD